MAGSVNPAWDGIAPAAIAGASLPGLLGAPQIERRTEAAWTSLKPTLERLVLALRARRVLEIGGGRHPFFTPEEADRHGFRLTVNDIDAEELDHAPGSHDRLVLDIARPIDWDAMSPARYDLVYSRMVFEHVRDARRAWANVRELLVPGGVGFAFVPTLYSPPFVLNRALPEALTGPVVRALDGSRHPGAVPKFPAYYRACRASEARLRPFLTELGFREVCVVPFYGTPYFPRVPVLRTLAAGFDRLVEDRDWRLFASYAYIAARR